MSTFAQNLQIYDPENPTGTPFLLQGPLGTEFNTLADVINAIVNILFPIALIVAFVIVVKSGFDLSRSMGDPAAIKKAQAHITNAVVGIILLALSYWLAQIAVRFFFP